MLYWWKWIHSVLTGDTTLNNGVVGGWQETPLEGTPTPWGVVEALGKPDFRADEGAQLIWERPTVRITLYDRYANYTRIEPLADRVYELLHGQYSLVVPGGIITSCVRTIPTHGVETEGGIETRWLRHEFEIEANPTN